uniref:Uncharacterized protein n=1 Tax=Kwoniella pini CBS 10737 TaxID=1296096 RepID=A0A1B9I3D8_9TREE|nr:uncharacterized protein I206_04555 [Kwoniella pini CBS 10737]OCF50024.1 hypothetical protein I206_04555 [Kwoniella pini CBS 10737]
MSWLTMQNFEGILIDHQGKKQGLTTREMFSKSFDVNVIGTHIIIETLLRTSMSSSKIAENPIPYFNISPPSGWPKETCSKDFWAYKSTKLALIMIM